MDFVIALVIAGATFGLCALADKGYKRIFRSKAQHASGRSVRLSSRTGAMGAILIALGLAALTAGAQSLWLLVGGIVIELAGIGFSVYYLTFGIFYDDDSFLYTTFGKKSVAYRHEQIRGQKVYVLQGGNVMVELYMTDGNALQVQLQLKNATDFLNTAYARWLAVRGLDPRQCAFHDVENSCWFPPVEEV